MTVEAPQVHDDRRLTRRIWNQYSNQFILVAFIAATYSLPVTNSIVHYLTNDTQPSVSAHSLPGYYLFAIFTTVSVVVLSFALVRPKEMSLFLTKEEDKRQGNSWTVLGIAVVAFLTANMIRGVLESEIGSRDFSVFTYGPWHEIIVVVLHSGPYEEIMAATVILLGLRAKWHPAMIIGLVGILRGVWHLYAGPAAAITAAALFAVFAWLFLRYRRVGPLILVHIWADAMWWMSMFLHNSHNLT